jgi:type 2 lantibiotic biosynthesis protein LanM
MQSPVVEFPWGRTTFLHERVLPGDRPPVSDVPASLQEAERRETAWRQLMSADEALLTERLSHVGLDRAAFLRLLARSGSEEEPAPCPSTWSTLLREVLTRRHANEPLPTSLRAPPSTRGEPGLPFSGFFRPFLQEGAARLREGLSSLHARHALTQPLLSAGAEEQLLAQLARKFQPLATRTLILELNVARMLDQLPGGTPHERFRHFSTTWFEEPRRVPSLLEEYPVLARLLATALERWLTTSLELLERLATDRALLQDTFCSGRDLGPLVSIEGGLSDLHREGRSVAVLQFGAGLRLVYKPKSLAADERFQQLLQWFNTQGPRHAHRVLTVLDRGAHGWVEFVAFSGCDSRETLQRFYWRQGSSLALLHLLAAVDFHQENLIAAGEYPVLVDLEALFHHAPPLEHGERAYERATQWLERSTLAVGLLPVHVFGRAGHAGVDVSGLGGEPGQLFPTPVPMLEDVYQDTMRVVRREGRTSGSANRPRLGEQLVDPTEFTEEIVQGFQETYQLLLEHRDALEPRLRAFADVEVRHILRATQRYATLLQESHHPDFLRDGLERDKVLDHLWAEVPFLSALRRTVPHEHADLRLGDIPMFTARPGERHLWSSSGECISDYFARDSLGEVLERLAAMDARDCARQAALIRNSMLSISRSREPVRAAPSQTAQRPSLEATPEDLLAAALSIGEHLQAQAIRGREDACWIGMNLDDLGQWRWSLSPLGPDVYEGVGGMALLFAFLAARTGRTDFEALARAALEPVRQAWREPVPPGSPIGAFVGRASAVYVLGQLAALWNAPHLLDEVLAGLPALERLIAADTNLDLLSGAAGCAVVLLGLHKQTGDARLLDAARRCGERLLATAVEDAASGGVGWPSPMGGRPLAGFSHGVAGIAWALLELASATGDARYAELARRGLTYERSLFVPARGNWWDLREQEGAPTREGEQAFMCAWCHGAPGIALGRLLSLRHLDEARLREELTLALETTRREGLIGNHSLCHGDLGNLEVLHLAGELLAEPCWTHAALERAGEVLRQGREGGWRCGLPHGNETPGLMMGLAGIGYGLLRLAWPERVPSVLALRPVTSAPSALYLD